MSFCRLENISQRYRAPRGYNQGLNTTITSPVEVDETDYTDTDSVVTTSSISSEQTVTDDGVEHILDYQERVRRHRDAQTRLRNTWQYTRDRINHGLDAAQEIGDGGQQFYHGRALPIFDEALLQIRIAITVVCRLLVRFIEFGLSLLEYIVWSIGKWINASFCFLLNLIYASIWFAFDLVQRAFDLVVDLMLAIPWLLQAAPWHLSHYVVVGTGVLMIAISIMHGFTSTARYICNDTELAGNWTTVSDICQSSNVNAALSMENTMVASLVDASNTIWNSADHLNGAKDLNLLPSRDLVRESIALRQFAIEHNESLSPFLKSADIVAVAQAVESNVTAFNRALSIFANEHDIRMKELGLKGAHILAASRELTAQSPTERFLSESLSYFLPSTFYLTSTARNTAAYNAVATYFLSTNETTSIRQQAVVISQSYYNIVQGFAIAKAAIERFEPYWQPLCKETNPAFLPDIKRCHQDPTELIQNLSTSLEKMGASAALVAEIDHLHKAVDGGLTDLRAALGRLLRAAYGVRGGVVDAASARAVLRLFALEVGKCEVRLGTGPREDGLTLEERIHRGSTKEVFNGSVRPVMDRYIRTVEAEYGEVH